MEPISSIRPAGGTAPTAPVRPTPQEAPKSQEAAPESSTPLHDAPARSARAVEPAELAAATERLNDFLRHSSKVRFQMGEGDLMVQVIDSATDEVIRSIPAEEVLQIRDHFRELTGILLDDRV